MHLHPVFDSTNSNKINTNMKSLLEIIKADAKKNSPFSQHSLKKISTKFNDLLQKLNGEMELSAVQKSNLDLLFKEIKLNKLCAKLVLYLDPPVYKDFLLSLALLKLVVLLYKEHQHI